MTVEELLSKLDHAELVEWMAFYELEPWGTDIDFLKSGIVASTIANVNRPKNSKPYQPQDFIPNFDQKETKKQTWQEQLAIVEQINTALSGKDERKTK